ncbi:MAG: amidohydrolase family protein [Candidatus Latescibacteria bacterium]|jgi:imidazolonepropionase-like amidohydrolase|nr:amidohydrolase family protein [Candidatus Latescibacterota bacterium]
MGAKAIVNARVIDGTGGDTKEGATIVVEDGRIAAIGEGDVVSIPEGAERIDAKGQTVVPGLIDGHIHITSMPGLLDAHGHLEQSLKAVGKLRRCLQRGVTTVANMGGCPENVILSRAIESGDVSGCARMIVAAMVNATGGHVRGRSADGPWEVRKAVREMILSGAHLIKTAATGGFMWEHEKVEWEDYTLEELTALVEESHSKEKRVAVHAHSQPGLDASIAAGCDVIAHGALIDDEALEGIAAKNLFYMPTLYITSDHVLNRPNLAKHMHERMSHAHPIHREGVRKAREMGVKLCLGTDGGPGDAMLELVELVGCGLTPMEAIVTGTRNTAESLDILDQVGTLEAGKQADLLIVEGDPLEDISVLADQENVLLVMKAGKVEGTAEGWKEYLHPRE